MKQARHAGVLSRGMIYLTKKQKFGVYRVKFVSNNFDNMEEIFTKGGMEEIFTKGGTSIPRSPDIYLL